MAAFVRGIQGRPLGKILDSVGTVSLELVASVTISFHQSDRHLMANALSDPRYALSDGASTVPSSLPRTVAARIRVVSDFDVIEAEWRALEADCVMSVYHCFDWLKNWHAHVGRHECADLALVVGEIDGATAFILPLGIWRSGPLRVASWLGGKLNNYNFGLWRADVYTTLAPDTLRKSLKDVAAQARIDSFELHNIPEIWSGLRSPFLGLAHTPSPSASYVMDLESDFDTLYGKARSSKSRRSLRKKYDRLQEAGHVDIVHAITPEQARIAADATIELRNERALEAGIPSVFANSGVADLIRDTAISAAGQAEPVLDTHYLAVDGIVRATYVGGVKNGRYSCSLNSFRDDDLTAMSPGDLLLTEVIRNCCERGLTQLDLGIGEMRYKTAWCEADPLIDCFVPVTLAGRFHATARSWVQTAKRLIKGNPVLWQMVLRLRKLRAKRG
ncbi:GNAT family N-acetyltransferase [Breoghania sp. L-A4]|uniref:GNAT family N-acetyltransferase n=1 Tax=Breoghania sp. L-A4 TaxID=2304600 RepID=UPI0013C35888|nr:GNAT family N-acetyltransferase [Breoghania sp. L-A4]